MTIYYQSNNIFETTGNCITFAEFGDTWIIDPGTKLFTESGYGIESAVGLSYLFNDGTIVSTGSIARTSAHRGDTRMNRVQIKWITEDLETPGRAVEFERECVLDNRGRRDCPGDIGLRGIRQQ